MSVETCCSFCAADSRKINFIDFYPPSATPAKHTDSISHYHTIHSPAVPSHSYTFAPLPATCHGAILKGTMTLEDARQFYADEVRIAANVRSAALVAAYAHVPREKFMGLPPWQITSQDTIAMAFMGLVGMAYSATENPLDLYHNVLVGLDPARYINNGQPSALARWIDELELAPGDHVYHLGCGVGYYTAIMAEVVGSSGQVVASEVDPALAARAQENLTGYPNVLVHAGDGAAFDPGPCDAILINAGVAHPHPRWLECLSARGRLVLPLTATLDSTNLAGTGIVAKITRQENGFACRPVTPAGIFSCTSGRDPEMSAALARAWVSKALLKLKSVRIDPHQQDETCLAHRPDVCLSTANLLARVILP
jgi:protein-L-isoaspartate(D-aspartate) O-methyltransferase